MRKLKLSTVLALLAILVFILPVSADDSTFPEVILLPTGFQPEGIEVGRGSTFFVGSRVSGAIYSGDLRTGEGDLLVPGDLGRIAVGLDYDQRSNALFVAGGGTGKAYVYDADSGELLEEYTLTAPGTFLNDVIVTCDAAYFTNSALAELYVLPLGPGGELPPADAVEVLPLSGDWNQVPGFNANGIESSPNGKWLIVVNSTLGTLYRVDPDTGEATLIDLGGENVIAGDGLELRDALLYVMRNRFNEITVIDFHNNLTEGEVVDRLTDPDFQVPSTIAAFGNAMYAVNAKFGVPNPLNQFEVVRVPLN